MMRDDFKRLLAFELSWLAKEGGQERMRSEAVEAVEGGIAALGLEPVVQAYLSTTFGVGALADLDDAQLGRAMLFIAQLERQAAPPAPQLPWQGASFKGEFLWVRGEVTAAGG
jgi:hypothetical protein